MTVLEAVGSVVNYAKEFVKDYKDSKIKKEEIDAIITDFVNHFANSYGMDLALYTKDLYDGQIMKQNMDDFQDNIIIEGLFIIRNKYIDFGIIKSIKRNNHMNNLSGIIDFSLDDALNIIDAFIDFYLHNKI